MTPEEIRECEMALAGAGSVLRDYIDAMYAAREKAEREINEARRRWRKQVLDLQRQRDDELDTLADRVKMRRDDLMHDAMTDTARMFIEAVEKGVE